MDVYTGLNANGTVEIFVDSNCIGTLGTLSVFEFGRITSSSYNDTLTIHGGDVQFYEGNAELSFEILVEDILSSCR